jgi:hypothetical protein
MKNVKHSWAIGEKVTVMSGTTAVITTGITSRTISHFDGVRTVHFTLWLGSGPLTFKVDGEATATAAKPVNGVTYTSRPYLGR